MHEIFEGMGLMYMLCVIAMIVVIIAMCVDLISGIRKAKSRGEARTSYGFSRTLTKFLIYQGIMMICACIDTLIHFIVYMMTDSVYLVPALSCFFGIVLCGVEGWSVYEKAEDKQRRRINDVATAAVKLIDKETLTEIVSDAIRQASQENKEK